MTFVSSLAKAQGKPADTHKIKQEGWLNERILVITPEDANKLTSIQRQAIYQIGCSLYGNILDGKH